ncbi:MAG TPA: SIS domain-containing protein [Symbiobacteriaceae bacterium]|nr:SIS domain-containing protein [Symbiobacteriaceae bacterium]
MPTRMWQEIQDQPDVAARLLEAAGGGTGGARAAQGATIAACRTDLRGVTRLILAGTGASLAACRVGQYAFMQYAGLLPHVLPAAELDYVQPAPGTLVILVSQSGQSLETQTAVDSLKARSIPFWGITNNPDSYLARNANRALLMHAGEEVSSATKTYMATLVLFALLAGGDQAAQHIPADLHATLAAAADPISRWAEALLNTRVGYILGMGPLGATASQGALLMKEKTFLHIEGMSLSEFRHGNIEVVTPGLPIIVLAVTPAQAAEAVKHAEYFASIGAEVCLITDSPVEASRLPADRILQVQNGGGAYTGQLQVVVPLQLLAERVAVRKGHDVDGFRYIAKVVDKYKL